ncbi:MAG TPA: Lrp/AsnC family transcriptional regulator, partial [Steroidobacteraceae bacterium]
LALLQTDASISHAELGARVNLSASQCSRRIARLQELGIIRGTVALLDEAELGLQLEAYVTVTLSSYARSEVQAFHSRVVELPQVIECCSLTGDSDYLLRVLTKDRAAFSKFLNEDLLGHGDVARVRSSIVLDRIKRTTALPLPDSHT